MVGGGLGCVTQGRKVRAHPSACVEGVRIVVAEPESVFHFAVTKWMRLGVNLGYRYVGRQRWSPGNDFQLSGGYMGGTIEFGWFDRS